jgi:hypothetical protein
MLRGGLPAPGRRRHRPEPGEEGGGGCDREVWCCGAREGGGREGRREEGKRGRLGRHFGGGEGAPESPSRWRLVHRVQCNKVLRDDVVAFQRQSFQMTLNMKNVLLLRENDSK